MCSKQNFKQIFLGAMYCLIISRYTLWVFSHSRTTSGYEREQLQGMHSSSELPERGPSD